MDLSRKKLWALLTGACATVSLAVGLGGCAVTSGPSGSALRDHAQAYLDAVASGDASRALELSDEIDGESLRGQPVSDVLLTDAVLGGATERISDVQIQSVRVNNAIQGEQGSSATDGSVSVTFVLDSETRRGSLGYRYVDGRWSLREGLIGYLALPCYPSSGVPLQIDGANVDLSGVTTTPGTQPGCEARSLALFNAVYHVRAVPGPTVEIVGSLPLEKKIVLAGVFPAASFEVPIRPGR
ncbi:MAG: hypothetical protein FWD18_09885 [Micrococcales bacterium]|nr:hypothetical protein [Micrococcales bacterium]